MRPALVRLGQALAFDKELSGNRDISCMTCHLPGFATGDGRSLSIGQGGTGLGPSRVHPSGALIARNAPAVFNLLALRSMFWDGRVAEDGPGRFHTPAAERLTPAMARAFEFGPLSAQPMFPVLSRAEMRGDGASNELAAISDAQPQQIWRAIMDRLGRIREYRELFEAAYPGKRFAEMNFAYASNAIAGFLVDQLAFND
ncbi:MAG TPA: cytochrome-c peroxidase, partial [Gemmatimonadales bacterium]|nr:cytochrome-c peroxidase [Gemmatimonadales bacterium]